MVSLIQSNETYDLSHSSASSHSKKGGMLERQRLAFFIGAARARQSLDRPMLGPHARWAIAGSRAAQRRPARRLHARRCRHPQRRAPSAAGSLCAPPCSLARGHTAAPADVHPLTLSARLECARMQANRKCAQQGAAPWATARPSAAHRQGHRQEHQTFWRCSKRPSGAAQGGAGLHGRA